MLPFLMVSDFQFSSSQTLRLLRALFNPKLLVLLRVINFLLHDSYIPSAASEGKNTASEANVESTSLSFSSFQDLGSS